MLFWASSALRPQPPILHRTPLPGTLVRVRRRDRSGGPPRRGPAGCRKQGSKGRQDAPLPRSRAADSDRLAAGLHEEVNTVIGFDLTASGAAAPSPACPACCSPRAAASCWTSRRRGPALGDRGDVGRPWIAVAHAGLLELLAPGSGGALSRLRLVPAARQGRAAALGRAPDEPAGDRAAGRSRPVRRRTGSRGGRRRIKTVLIPADGTPASFEAWSLLPGEERLVFDRRLSAPGRRPGPRRDDVREVRRLRQEAFPPLPSGPRPLAQGERAPSSSVETDCPLWFPSTPGRRRGQRRPGRTSCSPIPEGCEGRNCWSPPTGPGRREVRPKDHGAGS